MSSVRKLPPTDRWTDAQALSDSGFLAKFWSALLAISLIVPMLSLKPPKTVLPAVQPLILALRLEDQAIVPPAQPRDDERRLFARESEFTAVDVEKKPEPVVEKAPVNEQVLEEKKPEPKPIEKVKPVKPLPAKQKTEKARPVQRQATAPAQAAPGAINAQPSPVRAEATASSKSQALKILLAEIEKRKNYPRQARRTGAEGTVVMQVNIDASGRVSSCSIAKNCGIGVLDLETARLGDKLSGLDTGVRGATFSIRVPIRYSLQ